MVQGISIMFYRKDAQDLRENNCIPPDFSIRIPSARERTDGPLVGYLCFYVAQLDAYSEVATSFRFS